VVAWKVDQAEGNWNGGCRAPKGVEEHRRQGAEGRQRPDGADDDEGVTSTADDVRLDRMNRRYVPAVNVT